MVVGNGVCIRVVLKVWREVCCFVKDMVEVRDVFFKRVIFVLRVFMEVLIFVWFMAVVRDVWFLNV